MYYNVLNVKPQQSPSFFNYLTDVGDSRLFEATSDAYWGIGLDINFVSNTHPDFYKGSNVLGSLFENIRDEFIIKDAIRIQSSSTNLDTIS